MCETLWAVVVGGVLGGGFSITVLIVEHVRWKREFRLRYLQAERKRREEQCKRIASYLRNGVKSGLWSIELVAEYMIRLPKEVSEHISDLWHKKDLTQEKKRAELYQEVMLILQTYISKIDEEIGKLSR